MLGSNIQEDLLSSPEDAAAIMNSSFDRSQNSIDYESGAEAGEVEATPAANTRRPIPIIHQHVPGKPIQMYMEKYTIAMPKPTES